MKITSNGEVEMIFPKKVGNKWSYDVDHWIKRFCFLPRRCSETNELLWFKNAYYGYGQENDTFSRKLRWISSKIYTWKLLKE